MNETMVDAEVTYTIELGIRTPDEAINYEDEDL